MTDEDNNMNDYTYLFKALSNPVRLKILALCSQKPMTSKELRVALGIGISKPLLLAHLKILIKAGLIQYDVEIDSERGLIRKKYRTAKIRFCIDNNVIQKIAGFDKTNT